MKLSKAYTPSEHEDKIYKLWEEHSAFTPTHRGAKANYSIVVPPPNANGDLHLGHGLTLALEDIAVRYHRMKGEAALLLPGADHAGFETQVVYEKQLAKQGKSRFDYSREELYQQIWDFVAKNKDNYQSQFRRLGASVDWSRYVFTLDKKIVNTAYKTFQKMWAEGLIYRGERLVNFCTYHGTSFADIEVEYKDEPGHLWHLKYPLTDGSGEVVVATTRPETMLGDTAVAVHPDDKRYQSFVGKTVKLPLTNRDIPVIADTYVDMAYGTGAVKITPAHDPNDYEMSKRHDLPKITVIDFEGKMSNEAGVDFRGLTSQEARKKVIAELKQQDLLVKTEEISHSVGHCYKCGTVIEPLLKDQWFIDVKPLAKNAIAALKGNKIKFYPANKKDQLVRYLEGLHDWNISRQIAWGIPIPAFQNINDPDDWIYDERVGEEEIEVDHKTYRRDPDVFDTWFSSSSWPYATLDYPSGNDYKQFYPLSLMETAADILYPWVSRMIMMGLYNTGQVPFEEVYLHALIQDEHGAKMSKSKGNVVDPMSKLEKYGADAFRMGIVADESAGKNRPYDESKIVGARNFTNKLWNIARFVEDKLGDDFRRVGEPIPKNSADDWILYKLQQLSEKIAKDLDKYAFAEAYDKLYHLVWDDLADWYIEATKVEVNPSVLSFALATVLKLAHPFAPFVTEAIWHSLPGEKDLLITSHWPEISGYNAAQAKDFEEVIKIVTEVRLLKADLKLSKPRLDFGDSKLIEENTALIESLSGAGEVRPSDEGKGYHLNQTKQPVWMDIDESKLRAYAAELMSRAEEQEGQVKRLEARLSNKSYVDNAPEAVVNETKRQLEDALIQLGKLQAEAKRFS